MMKTLAIIRDVVVILGVLTVCGILAGERIQAEHARAVRLATMRTAIEGLEDAYKKTVFQDSETKGIYQQIFRQNEIALEYQKLLLVKDLIPTAGVTAVPPVPGK